jgi:hypothetical protein
VWAFRVLIYYFETEIAFLHRPIRTELRDVEWACLKADLASRAGVFIDDDDPILRPFFNGVLGTYRNARRISAMHASYGGWRAFYVRVRAMPDVINPPPPHPWFNTSPAFAGYFTAVALDAFIFQKSNAIFRGHTINPFPAWVHLFKK